MISYRKGRSLKEIVVRARLQQRREICWSSQHDLLLIKEKHIKIEFEHDTKLLVNTFFRERRDPSIQ